MDTINFSKYKRFFAFGCSFTQYSWPTWANIIAKEIPDHYIYAKSGAGNFFIFQALMEAMIHHSIDKDDLVMIMFSSITREDRFTKSKGWITPGNLYYQTEYDENYLKKYLCHHGYLMRDLNLVHGCKTILDSLECDYELMSMVPFNSEHSNEKLIDNVEYLLDFYSDTISKVKPSVLTTIFNNNWESKPNRPTYKVGWSKELYRDNHPTPLEHLEYLSFIYPNITFSTDTLKFVQAADDLTRSANFSTEKMDQQYSKNIYPRLGISKVYE